MATTPGGDDAGPTTHLPMWVASLLIQAGSFLLVAGIGLTALGVAYGLGSAWHGLGLVAVGYAAVGFPGWYVVRGPRYHARLRRLAARLPVPAS